MTMHLKAIFLSAALAVMILPLAAQDSPTTTPGSTVSPTQTPDPPSAQKPPVGAETSKQEAKERQKNEQERIAQGVKSGELTSKEASQLEQKQVRMNKEIKAMKDANGGKLSAADAAKVQRQQQRLSRDINQQKHDAQVQGGNSGGGQQQANNPIAQRKENQQDRIANGVKSGELTPGEASHLENQENHINNETSKMRAENGGKLTDAEKQKVEHQQNRVSKEIRHQKHDAQRTRTRTR